MRSLSSVWDLLVSTDEKIRRQLGYWAVTAGMYLLCTGLLWLEVSFGEASRLATAWTSIAMVGGLLPFFLLIRLSARLALRPSQLALAQSILAIIGTVVFYALSGPARGATLSILLVVLVVAFLTGKLSQLRCDLKAQKAELADALARIRILATQDELTSLANRRHMSEVLADEERRLRTSGQPTCLALLDIDWFKQINDKHGHDAGDAVLRLFAGQAQAALRATDVLARWGGEEFLLLMRDTHLDDATQVLDRVRDRIALACAVELPHLPVVTFSAGLVAMSPGEGVAAGIRRADQALYRAKSEGRNRVMFAYS